ncbi:MAG: hypothetical protein ACTH01_04290 [Micrococcaceae bacterium]
MTRIVVVQLAALSALVVTIFLSADLNALSETPWKQVLVVATIVLAAVAAIFELTDATRSRPKQFRGRKRNEKILKYMIELLSTEEHCVISSNDLSWVETKARETLIRKASNNSLTLLMPRPNAISEELAGFGAKTHYYGNEDFKFLSRFTLINAGRSDGRVAIGFSSHDSHKIRMFEAKDDPAVHLAEDLFELVKRSSKKVDVA